MPFTVVPNGHSDDYFIARVRRILRDQSVVVPDNLPADGTQGTALPGSKPFRLSRPPIIRGSVQITATPAVAVVYDATPVTGQAAVNTDTGELIFFAPPASGTVAVTYQSAKYGDLQILDALQEGLEALYPDIWQIAQDSTSIVLAATQFEYTLPQILNDPRVVLLAVEVMFPSGFIRWFTIRDWDLVGASSIKFGHLRTPGSQVRLSYNAPYEGLGDVEPKCMHLPVYYAVGRLLADQETERTRQGDIVPLTGQGASQPGVSVRMADYWMQRFEIERHRFSRPLPIRASIALATQ